MSILGLSSTAMVGRYAHVMAPIHNDVATHLNGFLWTETPAELEPGIAPAPSSIHLDTMLAMIRLVSWNMPTKSQHGLPCGMSAPTSLSSRKLEGRARNGPTL